eukprot:262794-Pelagomonas_calceolata.AAC.2
MGDALPDTSNLLLSPKQPPASSRQVAICALRAHPGSTCRLGGAAGGLGHTGGKFGWLSA